MPRMGQMSGLSPMLGAGCGGLIGAGPSVLPVPIAEPVPVPVPVQTAAPLPMVGYGAGLGALTAHPAASLVNDIPISVGPVSCGYSPWRQPIADCPIYSTSRASSWLTFSDLRTLWRLRLASQTSLCSAFLQSRCLSLELRLSEAMA